MEELDVTESLSLMGQWVVNNETLLIQYAVNVVAAIIILLIGLLVARGIDTTVADFLAALVRYGIIAFTLIAVLSHIGVQTASVRLF